MVEVTNLELDANNRAWADSNATAAYYNALAQGQTTSAAQAAAQFAWKQKMDEASQTGMWNGQYNMPTEQNFANMFGSWMPQGPNTGQQTLTAQQQEYNQAYQNSQLYGQYFAPGAQGAPAVGQQTLVAQNQANQLGLSQANLTGYYVAPGSAAVPRTGRSTSRCWGPHPVACATSLRRQWASTCLAAEPPRAMRLRPRVFNR
jgi:hypothetical protein